MTSYIYRPPTGPVSGERVSVLISVQSKSSSAACIHKLQRNRWSWTSSKSQVFGKFPGWIANEAENRVFKHISLMRRHFCKVEWKTNIFRTSSHLNRIKIFSFFLRCSMIYYGKSALQFSVRYTVFAILPALFETVHIYVPTSSEVISGMTYSLSAETSFSCIYKIYRNKKYTVLGFMLQFIYQGKF